MCGGWGCTCRSVCMYMWECVHVGVCVCTCGSVCTWECVCVRVGVCTCGSVHVGVCARGSVCTCGSVCACFDGCSCFFSLGHHSFELHTFEKPFYCDACSKLLYGCYFQGYLCSGTDLVWCCCCLLSVHPPPPPPLPPPPSHTHTHCSMQEDCP